MRRSLSIIAVALVAASGAGSAQAQETLPDGNSAVDQYVDPLPGFDGDRPAGTGGSGSGGGGGAKPKNGISDVPLPLRTQKKLAANGADGFRVAALVADTAPAPPGDAGAAKAAKPALVEGSASTSRNGLLADVVEGRMPDGLGSLLPVVMVLSAVAIAAVAILRRSRGPGPL